MLYIETYYPPRSEALAYLENSATSLPSEKFAQVTIPHGVDYLVGPPLVAPRTAIWPLKEIYHHEDISLNASGFRDVEELPFIFGPRSCSDCACDGGEYAIHLASACYNQISYSILYRDTIICLFFPVTYYPNALILPEFCVDADEQRKPSHFIQFESLTFTSTEPTSASFTRKLYTYDLSKLSFDFHASTLGSTFQLLVQLEASNYCNREWLYVWLSLFRNSVTVNLATVTISKYEIQAVDSGPNDCRFSFLAE